MADFAGLSALHATQAEVTALIAHLVAAKEADSPPTLKHNPLGVWHTAGTLLRAQATHLGLLAITPPFTPTALTTTLRTIIKLLPAFVAACEDARHPRIPQVVEREARMRVRSLLDAVRGFVAAIPHDAAAQARAETQDSGERRMLRGTGVVWAGCDWFIEAGEKGPRWIATSKLQTWKELVDDAAEEIDEWLAMEPDEDSDSEDFFGDPKACPPELEPMARKVQKNITHLQTLFVALQQDVDRIPLHKQTRPEDLPDAKTVQRLDKTLELAAEISREVDEWVAALYDNVDVGEQLARARESLGQQAAAVGQSSWVRTWEID